jgi:hypothetical protein
MEAKVSDQPVVVERRHRGKTALVMMQVATLPAWLHSWIERGDVTALSALEAATWPAVAQAFAETERAAAAEAVRPFEALGAHSAEMHGRTVVIEFCKGRMTVVDEMTEKFGEGQTVTEAAVNLVEQLGLGKKESGR